MKVNQHRDLPAVTPVSRPTPGPKPPTAVNTTDFTAAIQLTTRLATVPEVRSDQVARAKALIADPNYPNTATVEKVARQLADRISTSSPSE